MKKTEQGLMYREYKEGCIEIFRPKRKKASFYVTEGYLVDLFVRLEDIYDDIEQLIEQKEVIKKCMQ